MGTAWTRQGTAAARIAAAVMLMCGMIASNVPNAGAQVPPESASDQTSDSNWRTPDASVDQDPAGIVAAETNVKGPATQKQLRVVSVIAGAVHPIIRTETVRGVDAAQDAIDDAQQDPRLVSVGIDQRVQLSDVDASLSTNDTYASSLWGINRIAAQTAWDMPGVNRGSGVKVAVVDTGVSVHDDLAGTILAGYDATAAAGNGRNDGHGHGTHVAGTIAATANNGRGVAGVAPNASIIPVKVLSDSGSGYTSDVAEGIIWAADHGADIISMSLGGGAASAMQTAVEYAQSKGDLVVAAAGNSRQSGSPTSYPAAYAGVLGVAATTSDDSIAYYSNQGSYVDIAAPGSSIMSTIPTNSYASWSGTSMATPHVSGVAALVLAKERTAGVTTPLDMLLTGTADDLGAAGWDSDFGYGLVDPVGAIGQLSNQTNPPPAPTNVTVSAVTSTTATVSWSADDGATQFSASTSPAGGSCTASGTQRSCTLTGMTASTDYQVHVIARSLGGDSPPSSAASLRTSDRVDLGSDTLVGATALGGTPQTATDPIDLPSDVDHWKFVNPVSGTVTVSLTNLPDDYDLYVMSTGGQLLGYSLYAYTHDDVVTLDLAAGEYVAKVLPYTGHSSTPYRISVSTPQVVEPTPDPTPTDSESPTPEPAEPTSEPTPTEPTPSEPTSEPSPTEPTPEPTTPEPSPTEPEPSPSPTTPAAPVPPVQVSTRRIQVRSSTTLPALAAGSAVSWATNKPAVCKRVGRVVTGKRVGSCLAVGRVATERNGRRSLEVRYRITIRVVR